MVQQVKMGEPRVSKERIWTMYFCKMHIRRARKKLNFASARSKTCGLSSSRSSWWILTTRSILWPCSSGRIRRRASFRTQAGSSPYRPSCRDRSSSSGGSTQSYVYSGPASLTVDGKRRRDEPLRILTKAMIIDENNLHQRMASRKKRMTGLRVNTTPPRLATWTWIKMALARLCLAGRARTSSRSFCCRTRH